MFVLDLSKVIFLLPLDIEAFSIFPLFIFFKFTLPFVATILFLSVSLPLKLILPDISISPSVDFISVWLKFPLLFSKLSLSFAWIVELVKFAVEFFMDISL